jgi:hypothetical protein
MIIFPLFLIILLFNEYNSQMTNCSDQLYNYFVSKGMPANTTILPVVNLTQGIAGGTTYVDALYLFQQAARTYQTILDNGSTMNAVNLFINSFSIDIPWCTIEVDMTCVANFVGCCIAKPNCTDLNDFDPGGSAPVAGRMLIYPDQNPPCNGVALIRWVNTVIVGGFPGNFNQYTFDNYGLQHLVKPTHMPTTTPTQFPTESPTNFPTFEPTEVPTGAPSKTPTSAPTAFPTLSPQPTAAPSFSPTRFPTKAPTKFPTGNPTPEPTRTPTISPTSAPTTELTAALTFSETELNYRFSTCIFNNGSEIFAINQSLFRCIDFQIGCNTSRQNGIASKRNVPLPQYSCFINATNTSGAQMVWRLISMAPLNTYDGFFGVSFFISNLPPITIPQLQNQIIVAGSYRQVNSGIATGFNQQINIFYPPFPPGQGIQVQYKPNYIFSSNPVIRDLPCICGFSITCDQFGNFLLDDVVIAGFQLPGNQFPRCQTVGGENVIVPLQGNSNQTLILNGTLSSDIDGPLPISFLWKIVVQPIGSQPIIIPNATSPVNIINAKFSVGLYSFVLYTGDGYNVPTFCFANYTFQINVVTAVVANSFTIGSTPCAFGNSTFIPLNGTYSFETNTNLTLFYSWTQFLGWPVTPNTFSSACGNYTIGLFGSNQSLAFFVTNHVGLFGFNLTVTDGITTPSWATLYVRVVVQTIQPVPPPVFVPNFTQPPIRNFSQPPRNVVNFTAFPTSLSPTLPTQPTPPVEPTPPIEPTLEPTSAPTPNATPVPPLFPSFPPPSKLDTYIILLWCLMLVLGLVLFFGLWIAEFPFENTNFRDRLRYFFPANTVT